MAHFKPRIAVTADAEGRRWKPPQFNFKRTGDGALLAGAYGELSGFFTRSRGGFRSRAHSLAGRNCSNHHAIINEFAVSRGRELTFAALGIAGDHLRGQIEARQFRL